MTEQSKKDLERFTKFFTLKCINVIIQSRLGSKIKSDSKPFSGSNDWFNLTIEDNPEISKLTKARISSPLPILPINVELSLKTPEFSSLVLEVWTIKFDPNETEENVRILYTVYNRMNLLLKSLISITRITPAYKLSRLKSDYTICYNLWEGEVDLASCLGEEMRTGELGRIPTPFGTIILEFGWRVKMEVRSEFRPIYLSEDHYGEETEIDVKPKVGCFADLLEPSAEDELDDIPFSNLLKQSLQKLPPKKESIEDSLPIIQKDEDFVLVDLKTPFASENPNNDPVAFFHECQQAPNLISLPKQEPEEIEEQLEKFENSVFIFDDFVKSLCSE